MKLLNDMKELRDELKRREITEDEWNQYEFQARHLGMHKELIQVKAAHAHLLLKVEELIGKAEFISGMVIGNVIDPEKGKPEGVVPGLSEVK